MNADVTSMRRALAVAAIVVFASTLRGTREPDHARAALRIEARTPAELALALAWADDVWSETASPHDPVVAVFDRATLGRLHERGVPYTIVDPDIDATAAAEHARLAHRPADWFGDYRDVAELDARIALLAAQHPEVATSRTFGSSLEGRPIRGLEISRGGTRRIVIDGGHHGREWIAVMTPMCIADRLVTGSERDPRIRRLLAAIDFVIAPLVNPDGYHYTWTTDRYWRKNRRGGYGVDLGRNYSVAWGGEGSSGDQRSPNYRGTAPFSEPETRAVREMFAHGPVAAFVDFHSYSQVIAYPWSHQRAEPADRDAFATIAARMSGAMRAAHDHAYAVRPGSEFTTSVSGTAGDWSYAEHHALAFLVELRPSNGAGGGFVIPPDQIAPTCDEALAGVLALAEAIAR